jgi:hypothetical protein
MHDQGIALWRWLSWHRLQIATATALIGVVALLLFAGPVLLVAGAVEWKYSRRRVLSLAIAGLLLRALVWLWQELRGLPHGQWHPCAQCGASIEAPSRAWYCSPLCRRYAQLEQDPRSPDPWFSERASVRLRTLARPTLDPASSEIPF